MITMKHQGQAPRAITSAPETTRILPIGVLTLEQTQECQTAIAQALQFLGKKNLSLILHGASFPSAPGEDTGIGSPNSQGARMLFDFLTGWGFNGLQLGPGGKTKPVDASPYVSTTFSDNPLFIDLKPLVEEGWLSRLTYERLVQKNPNSDKLPPAPGTGNAPDDTPDNTHRVAYDYIYPAQEAALIEAWQGFQKHNTWYSDRRQNFERFKQENAHWLEQDALYEALSSVHHNDYWPMWPDAQDRQLLSAKTEAKRLEAGVRATNLRLAAKDTIERYCFIQWLAHHQKEQTKQTARQLGLQLIADRQVGFSDRDVWAYQSLFLDDFYLGAPPDYFSQDGQAWGFPTLNPQQIFNADGSLGPAGQLLRRIFDKTFAENPGGVRIDHIIGLIDPWVYPQDKSPKPQDGAGRLYSSPEHPVLWAFSRIRRDQLNEGVDAAHEHRVQHLDTTDIERYGELVRLVLQSAADLGIPLSSIICEDLGTLTNPVKAVMNAFHLSGIRVTQFVDPKQPDHLYRGKNVAPKDWIMVGSHDNMPLLRWVAERFDANDISPHAEQLRQDLCPPPESGEQSDEPERFDFNRLDQDPQVFLAAKFAELFASPAENVQIFFTDFFGIDAFYNRPATGGPDNWSLRLPNDFKAFYHQQLQAGKALNLPQVLQIALEARGAHTDPHTRSLCQTLHQFACLLRQPPPSA